MDLKILLIRLSDMNRTSHITNKEPSPVPGSTNKTASQKVVFGNINIKVFLKKNDDP